MTVPGTPIEDGPENRGPLASELVRRVAVVDLGSRVLGHDLLHLLGEKFELLYRDRGLDPRLPQLRNDFLKQLFAVGSLWTRTGGVGREYGLSGKKQAAGNTPSRNCVLFLLKSPKRIMCIYKRFYVAIHT